MSQEKALEMVVVGLVMDRNTESPVVILKECDGDGCLPIWIGFSEATAIATSLKNVELSRPLTHDLISNIFDSLSVKLERIVITQIKDATYYAELIISDGSKTYIVDSRPSDAIALALRESALIYVTETVLKFAKSTGAYGRMMDGEVNFNNKEKLNDEKDEDDNSENRTLSFEKIDKDKWEELLDNLNPEDFKYKV